MEVTFQGPFFETEKVGEPRPRRSYSRQQGDCEMSERSLTRVSVSALPRTLLEEPTKQDNLYTPTTEI